MSLKAFHIVFVVVSILMCAITGLWGIKSFVEIGNAMHLVVGILCIVVGIGLVFYGIRVAKKLKNVSYL